MEVFMNFKTVLKITSLVVLTFAFSQAAFAMEKANQDLFKAAHTGNLALAQEALQNGARINSTERRGFAPLHIACRNNHSEIAKLLLEQGADINISKDGWTPLHSACLLNNPIIVKLLLEHDADINCKDQDGETAFDYAKSLEFNGIINLFSEGKQQKKEEHLVIVLPRLFAKPDDLKIDNLRAVKRT
jgi:uncharacterized protein